MIQQQGLIEVRCIFLYFVENKTHAKMVKTKRKRVQTNCDYEFCF